MNGLEVLRAENLAAYRRHTSAEGYKERVAESNARYIPALETEVNRLRALVGEPALGLPPEWESFVDRGTAEHRHNSLVPGCYRCDLGSDEARRAAIGAHLSADGAEA